MEKRVDGLFEGEKKLFPFEFSSPLELCSVKIYGNAESAAELSVTTSNRRNHDDDNGDGASFSPSHTIDSREK